MRSDVIIIIMLFPVPISFGSRNEVPARNGIPNARSNTTADLYPRLAIAPTVSHLCRSYYNVLVFERTEFLSAGNVSFHSVQNFIRRQRWLHTAYAVLLHNDGAGKQRAVALQLYASVRWPILYASCAAQTFARHEGGSNHMPRCE
jgi:hypothetical protein